MKQQNQIVAFMHCRRCLEELPFGKSPRDFASLEVGWTERGFQVWCKRHEINVVHVDFEGDKHPADLSIYGDFDDGRLLKAN